MEERIIAIIAEVLNIDGSIITPENNFREDLGADSLDVLDILLNIENEFNIMLPTDDVNSVITVKDLLECAKVAPHRIYG